jgi:hypothetical protein
VGAGVSVVVGCGVSVGGLGSVVIGAGKVMVGLAGSIALAQPVTKISDSRNNTSNNFLNIKTPLSKKLRMHLDDDIFFLIVPI